MMHETTFSYISPAMWLGCATVWLFAMYGFVTFTFRTARLIKRGYNFLCWRYSILSYKRNSRTAGI